MLTLAHSQTPSHLVITLQLAIIFLKECQILPTDGIKQKTSSRINRSMKQF